MNDVDALMTLALADELPDGGIGFVGVGSSGRAYTLVTAMPMAATHLARGRGIDFRLQLGPLIGVDLEQPPEVATDAAVYGWDAAAMLPTDVNFEHFQGGRVSVGFTSGAQIDRFGCVNVNEVIGRSGPVRLGGALGVPEILAFSGSVVILADLSPRTFVEEVTFVTGFGHRHGETTRADLGLPGGGPSALISDHGSFRMTAEGPRLETLFPGVSVEDVRSKVGFDFDSCGARELEPPSAAERALVDGFRIPRLPDAEPA